MKNLRFSFCPIFCVFFFGIFTQSNIHAQTVSLEQDLEFEQILNEKRKINSSITVIDRWKIQIFTGDSENSKKLFREFKRDFKTTDATIVFHTPNYKVWVGNFKNRIEAERSLLDIKEKYPGAFLIKPNK
ncbi:MAG: SPOR domain-containing protein [Flavobacteriaceae bacterium]|jgi:hypothetical protein|nr:SPOR domain-containing protein [Flavobacteriaceae bacterium]